MRVKAAPSSPTQPAGILVLAATDPANPYGAALSWPAVEHRVGRFAGAYVMLLDGRLVGFISRGGRKLVTWDLSETTLEAAAQAIADLAASQSRFAIHTIDGAGPATHPLGDLLARAGFVVGHKGLTWRRRQA